MTNSIKGQLTAADMPGLCWTLHWRDMFEPHRYIPRYNYHSQSTDGEIEGLENISNSLRVTPTSGKTRVWTSAFCLPEPTQLLSASAPTTVSLITLKHAHCSYTTLSNLLSSQISASLSCFSSNNGTKVLSNINTETQQEQNLHFLDLEKNRLLLPTVYLVWQSNKQ